MDIIIDFVGACVLHGFPNQSANVKDAQQTLHYLVNVGHRLVLYTEVGDKNLKHKLSWFRERGLIINNVTNSHKGTFVSTSSRRIPLSKNKLVSEKPFVNWEELRKSFN